MSKPTWGCSQWGQYEHDWLDCPSCLSAYELYLEEDEPMDEQQQQLRRMLIDYGAVKFGEFKLASGLTSDHYIDLRKAMMIARVAKLVGEMFYGISKGLCVDAVGGMEVGAIPVALATVMAYHQDAQWEARPHGFYVRKEKKEHGTGNLIEGRCWPGDRVFIVEDVATTGGSIVKAIEAVRAAGAVVVGVGVVVDREQGADEAFDAPFYPLLKKTDLGIKT